VVGLAADDASAGGEDDLLAVADGEEGGVLEVAEFFFAEGVEDFRDGEAILIYDKVIGIHEGESGCGGEAFAHGGFATAHEADEDDVWQHGLNWQNCVGLETPIFAGLPLECGHLEAA